MTARYLTALVALCACEPARCVTACGVTIVGEDVACAEYQRLENALVSRLPIADTCARLRGYSAVALPGRTSTHEGRSVEGWSDCAWRAIYFHADWWKPWRTAFVHELAHAAQDCRTPMPVDEGRDVDHSDWTRSGIGKAVLDVQYQFILEDNGLPPRK
jgi:hypothetical protein